MSKIYKINLNELLRKDIINSSKMQSPDRLQRSKKYSAKDFKDVNFKDLFEQDEFVWVAKVGKYLVTINFSGPFEELKWYVKGMRGPNRVNRISQKVVAQALSNALDTNDIYVSCTCPDWIYRFNFFATKDDYNYGSPETRPPKITNPNNNKGKVCKHILSVLVGKRWVPSAAKAWLMYMRSNPEITESFLWDMDIKRQKKLEKDAKNQTISAPKTDLDDNSGE